MDITGSVALVTGGNRGIGRAIVEALLSAGARKVYVGARSAAAADDLAARHGPRVHVLTLDVTRPEQIEGAARVAGDVSILVNNAGYLESTAALAPDAEASWQRHTEVNVLGPLRMARAFAPILKANGGGAVVQVDSIVSWVNFPVAAVYSMSKAAAASLTQAMRNELAGQGTHVIGVYPGPIDTDMSRDVPFAKVPPSVVADAIIAALRSGEREVFPDPMAQQVWSAYRADPIATTQQFASPALA